MRFGKLADAIEKAKHLVMKRDALEQVLFRRCVENGSYFFGKGGHHVKILSEMATPILGFSFTDIESLRADEITVLGLDAPNEHSRNSAQRRI